MYADSLIFLNKRTNKQKQKQTNHQLKTGPQMISAAKSKCSIHHITTENKTKQNCSSKQTKPAGKILS